jgi:Ca-activated chloride channel family protein
MHLNAHLDVDLIAVEQQDELALMLELTAPPAPGAAERAPARLEVVLDRSASMSDGRLEAALTALDALVARLDPTDRFGLVVFDDEVNIVVPAGPLSDKQAVREALRRVRTGGTTNLSGGYLRGLQEARRAAGEGGATLLLLSDGHANAGVTDAAELESIAANARRHGVSTGTLGLGLGYDEVLMAGVARGGTGNHHFAEEGDTAGRLIAGEIDGLLSQTAQAASLIIRPSGDVTGLRLWNDLPSTAIEGGVMVELGDFYGGETRKIVVSLSVPSMPALGLAKVAELQFRYVELPAATEHTVDVPVHVNVVPGDQAAGRIPDPVVRSELSYQQAQDAKRKASDALRAGDATGAARLYGEAGSVLSAAGAAAPPEMAADLSEESALLRELAGRAMADDASRVVKFSDADSARKGRKRGR